MSDDQQVEALTKQLRAARAESDGLRDLLIQAGRAVAAGEPFPSALHIWWQRNCAERPRTRSME